MVTFLAIILILTVIPLLMFTIAVGLMFFIMDLDQAGWDYGERSKK